MLLLVDDNEFGWDPIASNQKPTGRGQLSQRHPPDYSFDEQALPSEGGNLPVFGLSCGDYLRLALVHHKITKSFLLSIKV